MKVALLTREYPPEVYGGAGIHVGYLSRRLAHLTSLEVHCFGGERSAEKDLRVIAHRPLLEPDGRSPHLEALQVMSVDMAIAASLGDVDLVHTHTWYTNFAGHLAKLQYGIPHVATVHSLEPLRPWKVEQLGSGYAVSRFCERIGLESADAVIAVSTAMATDVCRCYPALDPERVTVIANGVDLEEFRPDPQTGVLQRYGINPDLPIVTCAARITRQKGLRYLLNATRFLQPGVQLVLVAGQADTPAAAHELGEAIAEVSAEGHQVVWIKDQLDRREMAQVLSHATVACCPSIYEPFGLVAVEALACQTPVVASAVGGLAEVVDHGVTGLLVPFEPVSEQVGDPARPERFSLDLAVALNTLLADPNLAAKMGKTGRERMEVFGWSSVARRTYALYKSLVGADNTRKTRR
jgi:alpha-maltose-1-phosphate synthase